MGGVLRYGRQLTLSREGEVVRTREQHFVDFTTVKEVEVMTHSITVKHSEKDAIAEFLRLIDRRKAEGITNIGLQTFENAEGKITRLEATWQVCKEA